MERFTETSGECRLFEECDRAEGWGDGWTGEAIVWDSVGVEGF